MARILDAHQVPHLPLEEVRRVPQSREGGDLRIVVGDLGIHLDHAAGRVVLDVVDALEMVFPVDRSDAREVLEPERVFQERTHRDQVASIDHDLDEPLPHHLGGLQFRTERAFQLRKDLLLGHGDGAAGDLRRLCDRGGHIWMTSSFLSAYWVATNMIPRNRKIENLATGDAEFKSPPQAKAHRRRKTAATSKTTKIRANM